MNQMGISLQCLLMQFLAVCKLVAFVIANGALFHNLAVSIVKLSWAHFSLATSFQFLVVVVLTLLSVGILLGLLFRNFKGQSGTCMIFHASVNLISPANWLTDGRLYLLRIDSVVIRAHVHVTHHNDRYFCGLGSLYLAGKFLDCFQLFSIDRVQIKPM